MEQTKREEPTQVFSVKEEGDKIYSVSTETFPYMATDGYNTIVTRQMEISEHKLVTLVEGIKEDLVNYPADIEQVKETLVKMNEELDEIKALDNWKLVKDNWEEFSKIYGGIQKESQLFQKENELKGLELRQDMDVKVLANYEEVLGKLKDDN